jgi:hypothetical protein
MSEAKFRRRLGVAAGPGRDFEYAQGVEGGGRA